MSINDHTTPVEYRDIPDFPGYRAGSDGTIWSYSVFWLTMIDGVPVHGKWKQLNGRNRVGRSGYIEVALRRNGQTLPKTLHTLVALTFKGPKPLHHEVCHNDGNPFNNRADNLRWGTRAENIADMYKHGTACIGERHSHAKLTDTEITEIRQRVAAGESQKAIAAEKNVGKVTIYQIVANRTWKHVSNEPEPSETSPSEYKFRPCPRVTQESAEEIRRLHSEGMSGKDIAALVGTSSTTVCRILKGIGKKYANPDHSGGTRGNLDE